jgi:hypothetical protein
MVIDSEAFIASLEAAIRDLEPPFLALPEHGLTAETLAYRRGARDAYKLILDEVRKGGGQ